MYAFAVIDPFLSIQNQDIIEERWIIYGWATINTFLSIQAQDFIEDSAFNPPARRKRNS